MGVDAETRRLEELYSAAQEDRRCTAAEEK